MNIEFMIIAGGMRSMVAKRTVDQTGVQQALEAFLKTPTDEQSVRQLEEPLEAHLTGTNLYLPTPTRAAVDRNNGAKVMALETKTDVEGKRVFFFPTDPGAPGARKLRTTQSMGPAWFAFGVPLRKLKLKFTVSRRLILPIHTLETPEHDTVYWVSFADVQMEARNVDLAAIAAAKTSTTKARAKKGAGKAAPAAPENA
jgi:hypothetical protein